MDVICIDPKSDPLWRILINKYNSDAFHSPEWIWALSNTYNLDVRARVVVDNTREPKAGIVYCKVEDMMDPRILSLPFSDFCDPLVTDHDDWNCLMNDLMAEQCRISLRCVHNSIPLGDERLDLISEDKWHRVDLRPDLDTIWNSLHSSARRAIKKAQRDGVVVQIAQGKEELRAFYELHLGVRKYKYHLLAQPYRFFENLWDQFVEAQKGALLVAVYQGRIIGGVMFLEWKDRLYYKFNASNPAHISHRPNDLVIWEGIKYGIAKGHAYLDFGISDGDQEGLVRYKRKYATVEKTISSLRYRPNGSPSRQEKLVRDLLPQLTDLFVGETVPDYVTEKAGEVLYRYFT